MFQDQEDPGVEFSRSAFNLGSSHENRTYMNWIVFIFERFGILRNLWRMGESVGVTVEFSQ